MAITARKEREAGTTAPGGRQAAVLWADTSGNIWLFGGFGLDSAGTGNAGPPPAGAILNDLWEFNITTKQWTWVSGSNLANQTGTYGAEATSNLSTGAATDMSRIALGRRRLERCQQQSLVFRWLGIRHQYHGPDWIPGRHLGVSAQLRAVDLVEGNQQCQPELRVCDHSHSRCRRRPFVNNVVGGRRGAAIWAPDPLGFVTIFGGEGYDSSKELPQAT